MKLRLWRRMVGPVASHDSQHGPQNVPTITAAQRDSIYEQILERISGIDYLHRLIQRNDLDAADRFTREIADDLQLVIDALGWGEGRGGIVELTLPPEQLRRTFTRLREGAVERREASSQQLAEPRASHECAGRVIEACDQVLVLVGGRRGAAQ